MTKFTPEIVEAAERADISSLFKESWIAINELRKAAREQLGQQAAEKMRAMLERVSHLNSFCELNSILPEVRTLLGTADQEDFSRLAVAPPPVRSDKNRELSISEMLTTLKWTIFMMRDGPIFPRDAVYSLMRNTVSNAEAVGIKPLKTGSDDGTS